MKKIIITVIIISLILILAIPVIKYKNIKNEYIITSNLWDSIPREPSVVNNETCEYTYSRLSDLEPTEGYVFIEITIQGPEESELNDIYLETSDEIFEAHEQGTLYLNKLDESLKNQECTSEEIKNIIYNEIFLIPLAASNSKAFKIKYSINNINFSEKINQK